jgi:hypothetical protein
MDQEVAKTLGELELKLQQLERELTSIGNRGERARPPQTQGRLVDEAVEPPTGQPGETAERAPARAGVESEAFGGPAVFGGEELPARAETPVGEGWTVDVRETAYGEISGAPSPPADASLDIPELVRFRDKLARTMNELIDEYSRLLSRARGGPETRRDA